MPKKIKGYDQKLTFINLLNAHNRARLHKTNRKEVVKFEFNIDNNLNSILRKLKTDSYEVGKYREFIVYEPKLRLIKALPYEDRIVQQWYIYEFVKPYIMKRFISTSCACIENKGTHYAADKIQKYMRKCKKENPDYYIVKCDIRKFFYSIDKNILYNIMKKYIKDSKLLKLTHTFIFNNDEIKGIPIGNYTSQYFANIYLNELDQYVKNVLKVKYYVRYMDDFVLIAKNKEEAKNLKNKIEKYINSELLLQYNDKCNYYPHKMGVDFCGYRIHETHRLIRKRSKRNIKKKIRKWKKMKEKNMDIYNEVLTGFKAFLAHSNHANSYNLQKKIYNEHIKELLKK